MQRQTAYTVNELGTPTQPRRPAVPELKLFWRRGVQTARLMVGVPDYNAYVAHRKACHPDEPVMSYTEFFRERQQARYATSNGKFAGC